MKILKFLVVVLLVISCDNSEPSENELNSSLLEPVITKADLNNATLAQKIEYKKSNMKVLTNWIAKNQGNIVSLMQANQKKSIKKDVEIFKLEDLVNYKIQVSAKNNNKENIEVLDAINAFKEIEGQDWIPSIFYDNGLDNVLRKSNTNTQTFLAVESEDLSGELVSAYEIIEGESDPDEILVPVNQTITPDFIGDNNLLVFELLMYDGEYTGGGGSGGGSGPSYKSLKLDKMKIKDLKEGWPFRSEISIKPYKLSTITPNFIYPCGDAVYASINCYTYPGNEIVTLKRSWKNDDRAYNWLIENSDFNSNDIVFYLIFEADWPAPIKTESIPLPNGAFSNVKYSSWQSIYHKKSLSLNSNNTYNWDYAYTYSKDNNVIKYNLK